VCTFGARSLHPGLEKATVSFFRPRHLEKIILKYDNTIIPLQMTDWPDVKSSNFQSTNTNFRGLPPIRCLSDGIDTCFAFFVLLPLFNFFKNIIFFVLIPISQRSLNFNYSLYYTLCLFQETKIWLCPSWSILDKNKNISAFFATLNIFLLCFFRRDTCVSSV